MKKKAIALIIVLGFITIIIGILSSVYKIYDKYLNNDFAKTISEDIILNKNIQNILGNFANNITDDDSITLLCKDYPNIVVNGNFRLNINIQPLFNRIDINNYNNNKSIQLFMNNLLDYYRISNIQFFEDILADSIDKDNKEREYGTEIKLHNPYFQDGAIYNYQQFQMIVNYYYKETKDKNIYKIPWKKLFYFQKTSYNFIDCNLLNNQFLKILGIQKNSKCKTILENLDKKTIKDLNIRAFNLKKPFYLEIKITYFFNNAKSIIKLIYDIKTKKVVSFEKYPIY